MLFLFYDISTFDISHTYTTFVCRTVLSPYLIPVERYHEIAPKLVDNLKTVDLFHLLCIFFCSLEPIPFLVQFLVGIFWLRIYVLFSPHSFVRCSGSSKPKWISKHDNAYKTFRYTFHTTFLWMKYKCVSIL